MRAFLMLVAAFLGGYAAVYGFQRFAPDEVVAAISSGRLPEAVIEGERWFTDSVADIGPRKVGDDDDADLDQDDDDDDSPVALLEIAGEERVLVFPPGVAEASGVMAAPVRTMNWVERYTSLGIVLDVTSLLSDIANLRGTELVLGQSDARLAPLRGRMDRLRHAYETGLVLLADVDLAERALRDEEMVRAEHAATRARTLRRIAHNWGTLFAEAAAAGTQLIEVLANRSRALVQVPRPERLGGQEFLVEIRLGETVRAAETLGPGYAEITGMGADAVLLLTDGAGLRPGLRVEVSFAAVDGLEPGVTLPTGAVLFHGDGIWVYSDLGKGRFRRQPLSGLRRLDRSWFVPESVLGPGVRVVIRGGQMLLAEEFRAEIMREDDD